MRLSPPREQKKRFLPLLLFVTLLFLAALVLLFLQDSFIRKPVESAPEIADLSGSLVTVNSYNAADMLVATGYGCIVFEEGVLLTGTEIIENYPVRLELVTASGMVADIDGILGGCMDKGFLLFSFDPAESPSPLTAAAIPRDGDFAAFLGSVRGHAIFLSSDGNDLAFSADSKPFPGDFLVNANGQLAGLVLSAAEDGYTATSAQDIAAFYEQNRYNRSSLRSFYRTLPDFDPASEDLETILDDIASQ